MPLYGIDWKSNASSSDKGGEAFSLVLAGGIT